MKPTTTVNCSLLAGMVLGAAIFIPMAGFSAPALSEDVAKATGPVNVVTEMPGARGLNRIVDQEAGVVCYIAASTGISCLPLSQTHLAERLLKKPAPVAPR